MRQLWLCKTLAACLQLLIGEPHCYGSAVGSGDASWLR
jgi:hypothetical protein